MSYLYLIIGFIILAVSASWLVDSAVILAKKMKLSNAVIGLTVVAIGTSMPELATSLLAALDGKSDIALANVVGSNTFNIILILGISGLLTTNTIDEKSRKIEIPVMMLSFIIVILASLDLVIARLEASFFLICLISFLIYSIKSVKIDPVSEADSNQKQYNLFLTIGIFIISIIGLICGSQFVLTGGVEIGKMLGLSDRVIGLTIVSIGTSLPEIGATVAAALKGQKEMAVANVVGSNIVNSLGILGISAFITPISVNKNILSEDLIIMSVTGLVLMMLAKFRPNFHKKEGLILSTMTVGYLFYLIAK